MSVWGTGNIVTLWSKTAKEIITLRRGNNEFIELTNFFFKTKSILDVTKRGQCVNSINSL